MVFCSALHGWSFSIRTFAQIYAAKFKMRVDRIERYLWGDYFYDSETKKFKETSVIGTRKLKRAFVQFIFEPIQKITWACMNGEEEEKLQIMMNALGLKLSNEEKEWKGKPLLKLIMRKWLGMKALEEDIVANVPDPVGKKTRDVCVMLFDEMEDKYGTCFVYGARVIGGKARSLSSHRAIDVNKKEKQVQGKLASFMVREVCEFDEYAEGDVILFLSETRLEDDGLMLPIYLYKE